MVGRDLNENVNIKQHAIDFRVVLVSAYCRNFGVSEREMKKLLVDIRFESRRKQRHQKQAN